MTPRPEAMNCYLDLRLPPAVRLLQLTVHGSFERIVNAEAAPHVVIDPTVIRHAWLRMGMHVSPSNALMRCSCMQHSLGMRPRTVARPPRAAATPYKCMAHLDRRQCMDVSIEGGLVTWRLQRSKCIADEAELGWAGMLLHPHAAWRRQVVAQFGKRAHLALLTWWRQLEGS